MAKKTKASKPIKVDFSDTSSGVKAGDHVITVDEVTLEKSSSDNDYLKWVLSTAKGGKIWYNTSLQPQALFNLRNVLEALGMEVPSSSINLDLGEVIGLEAGVTVEMEIYQGKAKPVIVMWMAVEDMGESEEEEEDEEPEEEDEEEDEEEEEEEKPSKKKTSKKKTSSKKKALKKGSKVTFEDDGETHEGKVTAIDDDVVTVDVDDEEWELDKDDLTVV